MITTKRARNKRNQNQHFKWKDPMKARDVDIWMSKKANQNQAKPNQTKPSQTKPNQTKPNQTKPKTKQNKTKQNKNVISTWIFLCTFSQLSDSPLINVRILLKYRKVKREQASPQSMPLGIILSSHCDGLLLLKYIDGIVLLNLQ